MLLFEVWLEIEPHTMKYIIVSMIVFLGILSCKTNEIDPNIVAGDLNGKPLFSDS